MNTHLGKNLIEFYGEDELMSRFGTLSPTVRERANEIDFLWFAYGEKHEVNVNHLEIEDSVIGFTAGLRTTFGPFNVMVRGERVRFRYEADAVFVRLKYSKGQ